MLSHVSFDVASLERSMRFYDAVLAAVGYERIWSARDAAGWGTAGTASERFAVKVGNGRAPGARFHLAFIAPSHAAVDAFHAAALTQGGHDDGPPGPRPHYAPDYYAAFVTDPDGYRIEAVCLVAPD